MLHEWHSKFYVCKKFYKCIHSYTLPVSLLISMPEWDKKRKKERVEGRKKEKKAGKNRRKVGKKEKENN